jgi:hypothetical protein
VSISGLFFTPIFYRISCSVIRSTIVKSSSILSSHSAILNWQLTSAASTNQGAAMALVSSHLMVMCPFLPAPAVHFFREIVMKMMSHSLVLLRREIEHLAATHSASHDALKLLILEMYCLYRSESSAQTSPAAAVH